MINKGWIKFFWKRRPNKWALDVFCYKVQSNGFMYCGSYDRFNQKCNELFGETFVNNLRLTKRDFHSITRLLIELDVTSSPSYRNIFKCSVAAGKLWILKWKIALREL